MNSLFLTAVEQKLLGKIPASVQEGWTVEEETLTSYETEYELAIRAQMADFRHYPGARKIFTAMQTPKKLGKISLAEFPMEALPELMFTIGARGMATMIIALLEHAKTDDDLKSIAGLSTLRHDVLQSNAAIRYI